MQETSQALHLSADEQAVLGVDDTEVEQWLAAEALHPQLSWRMDDNSHFGGYARTNRELDEFIESFSRCHGVPLEPVYSGKLFWRVCQEVELGRYEPGTELIIIHSGGFVPES